MQQLVAGHPDFLALGLGAGLVVVQVRLVWRRGGLRQLLWPSFARGREVADAARLAALPWAVAFVLAAAQLAACLFDPEDAGGRGAAALLVWLPVAALAGAAAHFIQHRRSRWVTSLGLLALVAITCALLWLDGPSAWLPVAALFLLWAVNGLRAARADATMN